MSNAKTTTYVAFGAAIAAVLALGFGFGNSEKGDDKSRAAVTASGGSTDMALPDMTDVTTTVATAAIDQDAIRAEIRDYLLEEPEILLEAFRLLEEKRVVEEAQSEIDMVKANADALFEDGFSYVGGNPEGSITLVEFQDYCCGFCKRAHGEVQQLVEQDGDIRLIIKEFPILGPDSMKTSELAIATLITQGDQAYKRISDAFMTYGGPVNDEAIERIAQGALVDIEQSRAVLEDPEVQRRITETRKLGQTMQISGTPTFVIGEKIVRGYLPLDQMAEIVELSRRVSQ